VNPPATMSARLHTKGVWRQQLRKPRPRVLALGMRARRRAELARRLRPFARSAHVGDRERRGFRGGRLEQEQARRLAGLQAPQEALFGGQQ